MSNDVNVSLSFLDFSVEHTLVQDGPLDIIEIVNRIKSRIAERIDR